jgi:hypothetical protein
MNEHSEEDASQVGGVVEEFEAGEDTNQEAKRLEYNDSIDGICNCW